MDGVNQLPALISQANEGARNAVHIHRDYDRDGHAYRRGPWKVGGLFFWCHFLVHRLLWVTIACLSFIHMCTMRQNLGEYHIKIDLSRRFFERYTKEGNFISGCLIQVPRWIDENGGLRAKVLQLLQVSHYKKKL